LRYGTASTNEYIEFCCKFFDTEKNGIQSAKEFESLLELLFGQSKEGE